MGLPRTISWQVSCKLADKTKDEIMTEVLRVFAGLDVKAVQVAYEVVRVTFASPEHFREEKSFSENGIFSFYGALSWGAAPLLRACTFSIFLSRRTTRSLEVAFEACGAVKSIKKQTFLSNQIIFDGTRLVDVALSGVQGHRSANYPNKDKRRKCGKTGHFARNSTFHGPAGDSADFPPLASSSQSAEASVSRDSSDSQFLKDNEVDLLQSQSILQGLVPVSGDSSEAESNQKASKRVGEDKGSSAKRSNSAPSPLSIFFLTIAKGLTLLLPILLN